VADPATVVFFHAHPDDEAIFTGGTMRLLADRGVRVVTNAGGLNPHGLAARIAALAGFENALSFDMGRVASTQSELQSFADNVALATAGELDGNADSITRAQAAAAAMITDTQTFGTNGQALNIGDVTLVLVD